MTGFYFTFIADRLCKFLLDSLYIEISTIENNLNFSQILITKFWFDYYSLISVHPTHFHCLDIQTSYTEKMMPRFTFSFLWHYCPNDVNAVKLSLSPRLSCCNMSRNLDHYHSIFSFITSLSH
jgi:hypothetical protein